MNAMTQALSDDLERSLDAIADESWVSGLRRRALDRFRESGLPSKRVERWRYTPLTLLESRAPRLANDADAARWEGVPPSLPGDAAVRLMDGVPLALPGHLPAGVSVQSIAAAVSSGDARLRRLLEAFDDHGPDSGLAALNTATLGRGLMVRVAEGIDGGRLLLHWAASPGSEALMGNARLCVLLEPGARLELVEQFESAPGTVSQFNLVAQFDLGDGASMVHTRLQQEPGEAILVTRTEADLAEGGDYRFTGLDIGGALVRHDIRARLNARGARCSLGAASVTHGRSHVDHHLDAEHCARDCNSQQDYRAVLGDRSRAVFNGRVYVAPGADGTDARQSSAALLLSPLAEIDSKPELEIYADEVSASHGATVGQLDANQVFYLRSRGLDEDSARNLLTLAFCRSVVDHVPSEDLRQALQDRLGGALGAVGLQND